MSSNSFKLLGKEEEERFPHPPPETEKGVMGNVRVFQFMSNVLELYIPKVFEMFIALIGGTPEQEDSAAPPTGNSRKDGDDIPHGEPK
ncbi:MAG: hypothetical protein ACI8P3_002519 [Saprospiraceae bacterium]|jgi:hypothetical protein